jgi:CubicO group peptidase (beta-lactamase class C family)
MRGDQRLEVPREKRHDDRHGGTGVTKPIRSTVDQSFGKLDEIVKRAMEQTGVPGISVAVVFDDRVLYQNGYGVRSTETKAPVQAETVFQIASLSKPVSATIMAGLVGGGKWNKYGKGTFAWEDPIIKYAPNVVLSDPWVTEHVTFKDLFAHRSGLPGGSAGNDLETIEYDRDTILRRLRYVPIEGFRNKYDYSNFGMTLAGDVAAKAAGSNWEDVSQQVLFDPVGMASTSMRHQDYLNQANRAELHVKIDGQWKPAFKRNPDAQAPAGGCSSNVIDLARWMRLSLKGGMLGDQPIIDKEALDATHTPVIMNRPPAPTIADPASFYALGWNIGMTPYGEVEWNHSGAFSVGASTVAKLIPSEGLGIVVLTNGAPIGVPEAIADAYFNHLHSIAVTDNEVLALWQQRFAGLYGKPPDVSKPANATAARPDTAYVGTYTNPYVGDIEIVAQNGKLEIVEGPNDMRFMLEHLDSDTFIYKHDPELPDYPAIVKFTVGPNGVATALTNSAFNATGQGTLTRV